MLFVFVCVSTSLDAQDGGGEMLHLAGKIARKGGLLFLTLPKACVDNSRFLDIGGLVEVLKTVGWETVSRRYSAKLVLVVCRLRDGHFENNMEQLPATRKHVVRKGGGRNNFAIEFGDGRRDTKGSWRRKKRRHGKSPKFAVATGVHGGAVGKKPTSSNQRKRARKKALQKKAA